MIASIFLTFLCVTCVLLAFIDLRLGIIPNRLNAAVAVAGLARASLLEDIAAALVAGCEAIAVGAIAWLLRWLFFHFRKYQGLGLGDVKLLAASGVWIGIAGVPVQLLVGSLTALTVAGILQFTGHEITRRTSLPFGPFLALGLLARFGMQQAGWISSAFASG